MSTILVCLFFVLLLRVSREQICHTTFFLECLYRARPLGGPRSLKCLPDSLNVYCANALGYSFFLFFYGRHRFSSGRCFFVGSFQDCCSCLIQLCKDEVPQLQLQMIFVCALNFCSWKPCVFICRQRHL